MALALPANRLCSHGDAGSPGNTESGDAEKHEETPENADWHDIGEGYFRRKSLNMNPKPNEKL